MCGSEVAWGKDREWEEKGPGEQLEKVQHLSKLPIPGSCFPRNLQIQGDLITGRERTHPGQSSPVGAPALSQNKLWFCCRSSWAGAHWREHADHVNETLYFVFYINKLRFCCYLTFVGLSEFLRASVIIQRPHPARVSLLQTPLPAFILPYFHIQL